MFKIFNNEKPKFDQWSVDQKLVCEGLSVDTIVYITNAIHTLNPLKVKVYETSVENGDGETETYLVCDVPNILLTMNDNIYVSLNGYDWLPGFEIDPCVKPKDYIYVETPTVSDAPEVDLTGYATEQFVRDSIPTSLPASDVAAWAKAATKPKYTASEVGALPSNTHIPSPTKISKTTVKPTKGMGTSYTLNHRDAPSGVGGVGSYIIDSDGDMYVIDGASSSQIMLTWQFNWKTILGIS